MKKEFIFVFMVLLFLFSVANINAQVNCGPTALGTAGCIGSVACGYQKCLANYNSCDRAVGGVCSNSEYVCNIDYASCTSGCAACFDCCGPECETQKGECFATTQGTYTAEQESCIAAANSMQAEIIGSGTYTGIGCGEMNDCMLKSAANGALKTSEMIKTCGAQIEKGTYKELLKTYGDKAATQFDTKIPDALETIKDGYQFQTSEAYRTVMQSGIEKADMNVIANNQGLDFLSEEFVRQINSNLGVELSWLKQSLVTVNVLKSNPYVQAAGVIGGIVGLGQNVYGLFSNDDEKEQVTYNQNVYYVAQNDISNAQNSNGDGQSTWSNCPGHRSSECAGKPICVVDARDGASQCLAALPGGERTDVKFGSIYITDKEQNNMFTLKGPQNKGIVYQQDGFVNIDKGGTTKISVAGQGAAITDINNNQLYLGRGTTTYLGIGNGDFDTYLTNTFILDSGSKVAVNAVNEIEQDRFKNNQSNQIANQNKELALTFNKRNLISDKNAVDISKFQENYYILTRGFSNIMLVETNKIFPLAARIFAKGDSLIVKNKNVRISNTYIVNDGNYEYTIQTIDDSTRALAKNKKVVQDSGPLDKKLSKRQSLLIYGI